MSRRRPFFARIRRAVAVAIASALARTRSMAMSLLRSRRAIPVEVVIADANRRRALDREIQRALQQLHRALGADLPGDLAVVVQQTVATDYPLAGCVQTNQRADGSRYHLIRLALQVNGRRQAIDDVLAALADACVGIVVQSGGPCVLVPLDAAERSAPTASAAGMRLDPLAPLPIGAAGGGARVP